MTTEDIFIKDLVDYLGIDVTEFDRNKIKSLLGEYRLAFPVPEPVIVYKNKVVYRTLEGNEPHPTELLPYLKPLEVVRVVSDITRVDVKSILGKNRIRESVEARHVSMYLIRKYCTSMSLKQIGNVFFRDHTTVIHSIENVKTKLEIEDYSYKTLISEAMEQILKKVV